MRKTVLLLSAVLVLALASIVGATALYEAEITVTDNTSTDRVGVGALVPFGVEEAVAYSFISENGTDVRVYEGTTEQYYMVSDNKIGILIPSLLALQERVYRLETGHNTTSTNLGVIPGRGGYVTITDNDTMEVGDNFTLMLSGFISTANGSGRIILVKEHAFRMQVSSITPGLIEAVILGALAYPETYLGSNDAQQQLFQGSAWYTQTFTSVTGFEATGVELYTYRNGVPGDVTLSIRATDGSGEPTGPDLIVKATSANGWAAGPAWGVVTFDSTFYAEPGVTYSIVVRVLGGGGAGQDIRWSADTTAPAYANGELGSSADSGVTWTMNPAMDFNFRVAGYPVTASVNVTSITTGMHTVNITADTTNMTLTIDVGEASESSNSTALGIVSVPLNSSNWTLMSDAFTYLGYYSHSVNGTEATRYQLNDIIIATTLPDVEGANDGIITWGANLDLILSVGGLVSTTSYTSIPTDEEEPPAVLPLPGDLDMWGDGAPVSIDWLPDSLVAPAAVLLDWDTNVLYSVLVIFAAIGLGVGVAIATGSSLLAVIAVGVGLVIASSTGAVGWWIVLVYGIFGGSYLVVARSM